MARILGIDYGTKRIGLAVTDPLQIIATGLETVPTEDIFNFLDAYFSQEEVEAIIIGDPLNLDGSPGKLTPRITEFLNRFKKKYPKIAIEKMDERFTSVDAKKIILESGAKKKKRRDKSLVDKVSAVLILQEFLEERRNKKVL